MAAWLLDTNVVGRLADVSAPEHPAVARAVTALLARGESLLLAPQVLVEFWVVATRPPAERRSLNLMRPRSSAR